MLADLAAVYIGADRDQELKKKNLNQRIDEIINGDRMQSVYQPICGVANGSIVGFECLTRFHLSPIQSPDVWFSDAASVGRGVDLETQAIKEGLNGLSELGDRGYISFNCSPQALISGKVNKVLHGLGGNQVVVEITEHHTISDYSALEEALLPLRSRGIPVAVDDAGAGYATFQHILWLQPDLIKLDRSLIQDIDQDAARRALVAAFLQFSKETGSQVIAEGVETENELAVLQRLGVAFAQGYLLGKPMPSRMWVPHPKRRPMPMAR